MISGGEQIRRAVIFSHALWEARAELVDRAEREVNREDLDWFKRERFDAAMEGHRRVLRALEEFRLQAAYDSEADSVKCTPEERSAARRLAFGILEGELSAESAADRLWSEGFPHDVFDASTSAG